MSKISIEHSTSQIYSIAIRAYLPLPNNKRGNIAHHILSFFRFLPPYQTRFSVGSSFKAPLPINLKQHPEHHIGGACTRLAVGISTRCANN